MRLAIALLGIIFSLLLTATGAQSSEKKIKLDKLPKPVVDAVKEKFPDAKLTKAVEETEKNTTVYKVSFKHKDHTYEGDYKKDGSVISLNRQIELKELPNTVAKSIEEKYPKARINLIEEAIKNDKVTHYELALVTSDKKEVDVEIDPEGKILKEEKSEKD